MACPPSRGWARSSLVNLFFVEAVFESVISSGWSIVVVVARTCLVLRSDVEMDCVMSAATVFYRTSSFGLDMAAHERHPQHLRNAINDLPTVESGKRTSRHGRSDARAKQETDS
ncbi:hypothetical protein AC578_6546 [Pseudocercospora eumusae]|uniref:Uncharacterized protein n=1 Tax=Pseudocercospora eumusae TaxID=321146 RepID=A0A139HHX6_9PEZI|nr:hypothetical protein AC578_6546 [Pseudocercospora eumusae]